MKLSPFFFLNHDFGRFFLNLDIEFSPKWNVGNLPLADFRLVDNFFLHLPTPNPKKMRMEIQFLYPFFKFLSEDQKHNLEHTILFCVKIGEVPRKIKFNWTMEWPREDFATKTNWNSAFVSGCCCDTTPPSGTVIFVTSQIYVLN